MRYTKGLNVQLLSKNEAKEPTLPLIAKKAVKLKPAGVLENKTFVISTIDQESATEQKKKDEGTVHVSKFWTTVYSNSDKARVRYDKYKMKSIPNRFQLIIKMEMV